MKNCYLVNYPCMPIEHLLTSWENNERSKPFVELTKGIIERNLRCVLCDNGWDGEGMEDVAAVIVLNSDLSDKFLANLSKISKEKCFLILLEPPNMERFKPHYSPSLKAIFGTIFTLFDELVDNQTYLKLYHWQARSQVIQDTIPFNEKKFCVMVQGRRAFDHPDSLFKERDLAAAYFAKDPEFDLYGYNWQGFPAWRGEWKPDKLELIKRYQFTICYDNTRNRKGFLTERLLEALYAKCIPVYWGAPDILDYVPGECFVNRMDFVSNEALYAHLKTFDEAMYLQKIDAGQAYLQSAFVQENFSVDSFAKSILHAADRRCLYQ